MIPIWAQRSLVTGDILAGRGNTWRQIAIALTMLGQATSWVVGLTGTNRLSSALKR